jgi:hypothetical protein
VRLAGILPAVGIQKRASRMRAARRQDAFAPMPSVADGTTFVYAIDKEKIVALLPRDQQNINAVSSRVQPQLHVR